jgi:aryl-alcohol dehydrogenase-like predicted oxidoreductase
MQRRQLGRTGIEVSEFFFGAGAIGGIGSSPTTRGRGLSTDEGLTRIDEAVEIGITVLDTANTYAGGESERVVGRWLNEREREDILIATKVGNLAEPGQHAVSLRADHIARQLAESVRRLGKVDLYLSHAPDADTPLAETLDAFAAAAGDGTIRAYGCSNVDVRDLEALLITADRLGVPRPGWVQNGFSLVAREDERDLLPLLRSEGLGYTPYSPLAGGILSDRYLHGEEPAPGSRLDVAAPMYADAMTESNLVAVRALAALARERDISTSALALAWLRWHPAVTAPIVSPRTSAQWTAVTEALEVDLDDETGQRIGDLFPAS